MSWAEVKKINDNLSTPINKYLENNCFHDNTQAIILQKSAQYSNLTKVIEVIGKGVVSAIYVKVVYVDTNTRIRIIADNDTIVDNTYTGRTGNPWGVDVYFNDLCNQKNIKAFNPYFPKIVTSGTFSQMDVGGNFIGGLHFDNNFSIEVVGAIPYQGEGILYKLKE